MQAIYSSFLLCLFTPLSASQGVAKLGSAAAAYQAHVNYQIQNETQLYRYAHCKTLTDHSECPSCSKFGAEQQALITLKQQDAIRDLYDVFCHVPHAVLWACFINKLASGTLKELYMNDRVGGRRELVSVTESLRKNICQASFDRSMLLQQQGLVAALDIPTPLIGIVAEYAQVPFGFNNLQVSAFCAVISQFTGESERVYAVESGKEILRRARCMLYEAGGIPVGTYDSLDLSYNQIVEIRASDFAYGVDVFGLDLSHNIISSVEDGAFESVFSDEESADTSLKLNNNKLTRITKPMLSASSKTTLHHLDLSHNEICEIEEGDGAHGALSQHENLKTVNLSRNKLQRVPRQLFSMESLEAVNLDGNPFSAQEQELYKKLQEQIARNQEHTSCTVS
jgi:hypothetical protein